MNAEIIDAKLVLTKMLLTICYLRIIDGTGFRRTLESNPPSKTARRLLKCR
jgi:hypothetical protein